MIKRIAEEQLLKLASMFKAVAVIGPRQSGKTTLVRHLFKEKQYVNLENPDSRAFAAGDPRGFLKQYSSGAILDEAQRVPELFSYLQQVLDEDSTRGKFILTGSNNFLLQQSISQSLAGRIGYLILLPFEISEIIAPEDVYFTMAKGLYPPVYEPAMDPFLWHENYIRTYIERDVRQLRNIENLNLFEKFIRLCAGRVGQLINMSNLALETAVDVKTISSWINLLEQSFIVFRLQPHHQNFNKRLVKMPKLYFYDTGLVSHLLGMKSASQIPLHPLKGALFENFIISELIKIRYNRGKSDNLFFWRNHTGHEIDVIIDSPEKLHAIEIKSGQTISAEFFKGLSYWMKISNSQHGTVVYAGDEIQERNSGIRVIPWKNLVETEEIIQ